jgi:hypothetical protein
MSRRTLNTTEGSKNPSTKYLEWKSNDKCFAYWDKSLGEKGENVEVKLPFKFQFLEHFHTVKGWNDGSSSRIYANEVKFLSKEPLKVSAYKGGMIAEGFYSGIKNQVKDAGGDYHRSVYVVDDKGEIINIQFKGAVVAAYSDFMGDHENKLEGAWVTVVSAEDKKKGSVEYSVPVFEVGKPFTPEEMATANEKYLDISNYFDSYAKSVSVETEDKKEIESGDEEDGLAF